jgi:hypothetical protein
MRKNPPRTAAHRTSASGRSGGPEPPPDGPIGSVPPKPVPPPGPGDDPNPPTPAIGGSGVALGDGLARRPPAAELPDDGLALGLGEATGVATTRGQIGDQV